MEPEQTTPQSIDPATMSPEHQIAVSVIQEIGARMGQDTTVVVRDVQGAYLHVEIVGDDMPATWGRYGAGLDSLQMLTNLIISRRTRADVRLMLDAGGYRERRADTLRQRAIDLAREVKSINQEAEFEPLPPHERRIIHTALADDPDIHTYSEGEGTDRRIVISPR